MLEQAPVNDMVAAYGAIIQRAIIGRWSRPPSARNDMKAELVINMLPTGEVVGVEIAVSSGDPAFDRAAERAVKKVGRFNELQGMPIEVFEDYFRRFRLIFKPEDLRQ